MEWDAQFETRVDKIHGVRPYMFKLYSLYSEQQQSTYIYIYIQILGVFILRIVIQLLFIYYSSAISSHDLIFPSFSF